MIFEFENIYRGHTCALIGKGPSIDKLDAISGILDSSIVFCVNESIRKVEALGLKTALYCIQQDPALGQSCVPTKPTSIHFVREAEKEIDRQMQRALLPRAKFYNPGQFLGCGPSTLTAVIAIKLANFMGMRRFILVGFDSWKEVPDTDYAKCIGYSSAMSNGRPVSPERFVAEKHLIQKALEGSEYKNIFL